MTDFQKELILLAVCLSFFFGFSACAETVRIGLAAIH